MPKLNIELTLQHLKIMGGLTLMMLVFLMITSSTIQPEVEAKISATKPEKKAIDPTVAQLYALQQQELKIALNTYFEKAIKAGDIVGAGVSIVRGDSIVIADGFGKRNANGNNAVNGETVFRLGSLSKGFAGVLTASLKHEGKLTFSDKVVDYLPEFQLGDSNNTSAVTLANILSHTSGAPYHSFTNLVEARLPMRTIAKHFNEVTPISTPGTQYSYQNALFALSGEIIQQATGQEIATALTNRFFKPLGMCSTTMDYNTLAQTENVALPHSHRKHGWRTLPLRDSYYNAIAAGGINANAHDMGKWMRFLLGHNPEVYPQTAFKDAFNPFIKIPGHIKYYHRWPGHTKSYYGFGWRIHKFLEEGSSTEKTVWHHGGSVNNFRNEIAVYPETDLGICVLLNSNSRLARTVIPDLYAIVKEVYGRSELKVVQNNPANTITSLYE